MKNFSPSQTIDYLKCPTYWKLNKSWVTRSPWTPNLSLGAAMSVALAAFRNNPTEDGYRLAVEAARATLHERYVDNVQWSLEGLETLFTKGFDVALNKTVGAQLENEDVIGLELPIGEGRVDLVSRRKSTKEIIVTDDKIRLQLRADYVMKTLVEVEQDFQLWDYADKVTEYLGERVSFIRRHLIILSPKAAAHEQSFKITPEALIQHSGSTVLTHARMEVDEGRELPEIEMNKTQCIGKYGKCFLFDACHVLYRDESKLETLFDRKERS